MPARIVLLRSVRPDYPPRSRGADAAPGDFGAQPPPSKACVPPTQAFFMPTAARRFDDQLVTLF